MKQGRRGCHPEHTRAGGRATPGPLLSSPPAVIWFITNVDTEVLALRAAIEALPPGFDPVRAAQPWALDALDPLSLDGVRCVLVRLLRGRSAWPEGFDELRAGCVRHGIPLLAFGGEAGPDAEMTRLSTVASATVTEAFAYLVNGGPGNFEHLLRFVADTVLLEGYGFDPPHQIPSFGVWRAPKTRDHNRPLIGVVFYRAHLVAGNTRFVDDLCDAVEAAGGDALAVWCYSLRDRAAESVIELLSANRVDALVTTVLAAGGVAAGAGIVGGAGGLDGDAWDASALASLGVPILQSPSAGWSRADWEASDAGLGPYDATAGVAVPEFDGRIIVPVSAFNEVVDDGDDLGLAVRAYRTVPDRVARVAGLAVRHADLRRIPRQERRVAVVLSAFPTKRSRLGNAVGLDTPASLVRLLQALGDGGYHLSSVPGGGDEIMAALADGLTYEAASLTPAQLALALGRLDGHRYCDWFATLPEDARAEVEGAWGDAPGSHRLHDGALVFSGLELGNVLVAVQPPRGYGDDPVAVYHSPNLAPTHHYLGFYRWLDEVWGADAIVHLGKHGTLEWLPGKALALSSGCWPDAALGDMPLLYPFVVNDPGEGAQAKRRTHAVVVDHLLPPMTRADTYDELAQLEQLFDEYAQLQSLDPTKLPALRDRIWALHPPGRARLRPGGGGSSRRRGFRRLRAARGRLPLRAQGCPDPRRAPYPRRAPPEGEPLVDLVLAITRLAQGQIPSLREAMAAQLGRRPQRPPSLDEIEGRCRALVERAAARGWRPEAGDPGDPAHLTLAWICDWLVPRLARSTDEISNLLTGLDGGFVPAGPSGALTRGGAHVLPTGRNFYSLDPKALPSELSWEVGPGAGRPLLERHLEEEGRYPRTVGLVLWGTAAMRTQGDDVAEALALLGIRPVWEIGVAPGRRPRAGSPRRARSAPNRRDPAGVGVLPGRLSRTWSVSSTRPSSWPRRLPESSEQNYVKDHGADDPRVFGPQPGTYGAGILQVLEQRNWRSDDDLAAVYIAWSGYAYSRQGFGVAGRGRHAPPLRGHRRGREEPGQPRARHFRLRRLPPGARRDGGHHPLPDRSRPQGVVRRLGGSRPPAGPFTGRRGGAGRPHSRRQSPLDRGHAAPWLQRGVRDGGHRRLSVRLRRHGPRGRRTGCTSGSPRPTWPTPMSGSSSSSPTRGP